MRRLSFKVNQWALFDLVAMRRLQQADNHQLTLSNIRRLKMFENV